MQWDKLHPYIRVHHDVLLTNHTTNAVSTRLVKPKSTAAFKLSITTTDELIYMRHPPSITNIFFTPKPMGMQVVVY